MASNNNDTESSVATALSRRGMLTKLGVAGAVGLAGCTGGDGDGGGDGGSGGGGGGDGPINLGFVQQTSSQWGFLQPAITQAEKTAIQQVNDAGGPLGRELDVTFRDTGLDPTTYREVVQQFINNDGAVAIGGGGSTEISAQRDWVSDLGVPVISNSAGGVTPTFGGDNLTPEDVSDDDWFWRTKLMDKANVEGIVLQVLENGIETMGLLSGTAEGERSWIEDFTESFEEQGGEVVQVVETESEQTSYQAELSRLFEADFDAWGMALGLADGTTVLREWANAGYGKQVVLNNGYFQPQTIENVGEAAGGAWVAAASPEGPGYDQFKSAYDEMGDEDINPWATPGYDAVNVIALAIERAGTTDPVEIEKNIGPVTREGGPKVYTFEEGQAALEEEGECDYVGAATSCSFTENGLVLAPITINEISPDGFEEVNTISEEEVRETI